MNYRVCTTGASILVFAGSLVYAAPRSARLQKEAPETSAAHEQIDAMLDTLSHQITEGVTQDGMLVLAGVRRVKTANDGSMHVEIAYGGDFDRDMVLTIPRPGTLDEAGEIISVRGPDRIRLLEDHVVYIFHPVADARKAASTARKAVVYLPGVADDCEIAIDIETGKKRCKGDCQFSTKDCTWTVEEGSDLVCDCDKEQE